MDRSIHTVASGEIDPRILAAPSDVQGHEKGIRDPEHRTTMWHDAPRRSFLPTFAPHAQELRIGAKVQAISANRRCAVAALAERDLPSQLEGPGRREHHEIAFPRDVGQAFAQANRRAVVTPRHAFPPEDL